MFRVDPDWEKATSEGSSFWMNVSLPPKWQTVYGRIHSSGGVLSADEKMSTHLTEAGTVVSFEKVRSQCLVSRATNPVQLVHTSLGPSHAKTITKEKGRYPRGSQGQVIGIHSADRIAGYLWDMDATEGLLLTAHPNLLCIWERTQDGSLSLLKELSGHILDVNVAKFFPSGKVVLSGGADLALKIWSLENDGLCVSQLKGHSRGVTSCDFVDRGRNVVSAAKDGKAILWNIPSQEAIHTWNVEDELHACHLIRHSSASTGDSLDARDFSTEGHLFVVCGTNRSVKGFDLRSRAEAFSLTAGSAQNAVIGIPQSDLIVSGGEDGIASCWDLRSTGADGGQTLQAMDGRNRVTRLLGATNRSCWVANGDGSVNKWDTSSSFPSITLISDAEPIYGLVEQKGRIVTGSRRAVIRYYDIS